MQVVLSSTQIAEANLRQLQVEASLQTIKVSEAAKDLQVSRSDPRPLFDS